MARYPAESFLGIRFQQEMTKDELREIYPYGKVAAAVNWAHQNGALSRESLSYICERCRTTKGTMFISKLGHCICVDCSLVPALCEIPRLRGSMADYLFPEGSE